MSDLFSFSQNIPSWIDQRFFEKIVQHMENDSEARVCDFNINAGSKLGDNFASLIFRSTITFESKFTDGKEKSISVIIKTQMASALGEEQYDFLSESPLFQTEMDMYSKVLPEIQSLWLSAGDKDLLCPK